MPIACPSSDHHGSGAVNVNEHHSLPPSRPRARPGEVHKSVEEGGGHPASPFYGQQFCPAENKTSFAAREREREREREAVAKTGDGSENEARGAVCTIHGLLGRREVAKFG